MMSSPRKVVLALVFLAILLTVGLVVAGILPKKQPSLPLAPPLPSLPQNPPTPETGIVDEALPPPPPVLPME